MATDWLDEAQENTAREIESAVSRRVVYEGDSADECQECGELIPSARQVALPGVQHCVECAQILEAGRRLRA